MLPPVSEHSISSRTRSEDTSRQNQVVAVPISSSLGALSCLAGLQTLSKLKLVHHDYRQTDLRRVPSCTSATLLADDETLTREVM